MRKHFNNLPAALLKWAIGLLIPVLMFVILASVPVGDPGSRSADREDGVRVENASGGHPDHASPRSRPLSESN